MKKALTDSDICKLTFRGKIIQASRAEFDAVTGTRLESTVNLIRDMYALGAESGKNYPIPDLVLLVGGSTRMPQVRIRLEYALPGIPIRTFDPDEAVAKGAAIFASKYVDENSNVANEIIIGASKSYGLVIYDDENDVNYVNNFIIINSNINQPITETVYTWQNAQTETSLIVYENIFAAQRLDVREEMDEDTGEVRYINNRFNLKKVGESLLEFANPMPIDSPINITFDMSRGNTLSVTGEDPASHRVKQIDVKLKTELNADVKKAAAEEIQRRMQASKTR
jgi:molecular chaperone DnaK (HSP70)